SDMDATPWIGWFVSRVEQACLATLAQMQAAADKSAFWLDLQARHPDLAPSQRKVLNKLYDAQPEGFLGGMSTEKYVAITGVSRATAYRELTHLALIGLVVRTGQGRGTRYALAAGEAGGLP